MAALTCPSCQSVLEAREVFCPECRADLSTMWAEEDRKPLSFGAPPPPAPDPAPEPEPAPTSVAVATAAPAQLCDLCGNPFTGACATPGCPAAGPAETVTELPPPPPPPPPPQPLPPIPPPVPQSQAPPAAGCVRCGAGAGPVCPDCSRSPVPTLLLVVEGGQKVRWDGRDAARVPITSDELLIGRKDVLKRIYPDVDLHSYHERGEGFVARRHAQVVRERGSHFLVDLAGDDRTAFSETVEGEPRILTKDERVELKPGCRVVVGEVVGFEIRTPEG